MAASEHIFGFHVVGAILDRHPERVLRIWLQESRDDRRARTLRGQAQAAGVAVETVPRATLERMVGAVSHQGCVAEIRPRQAGGERELGDFLDGLDGAPFLLVLDEIQDPHNLGACLRTADAAGVDAVIVTRQRSAKLTPAVRKVASGAAETVPLFAVTNLAQTLETLRRRGIWVFGAAGEAETGLYQAELAGPLALVLGREGKGMRRLTREHCDVLLAIPMAGSVDSLNVSVATGILLFEARRQRDAR